MVGTGSVTENSQFCFGGSGNRSELRGVGEGS